MGLISFKWDSLDNRAITKDIHTKSFEALKIHGTIEWS